MFKGDQSMYNEITQEDNVKKVHLLSVIQTFQFLPYSNRQYVNAQFPKNL